ncbi:uncharacterized protein A1O5_00662 [Cladophialophora psammophila CBS 110553]|uniref:Uncharacterized protein n=1 Tax=Cladophialophora psammophila CBS 110553 TaxID=1182543 RepID=W9Y0X7_9EURO|nr:uncharacterized protein A1O5_00662 [Cladophialophora psammophila CBS 110553]EXJ76154.1 hypothetical protein A1O5_00662 [Cladophialophora psammophila CBS 110553]
MAIWNTAECSNLPLEPALVPDEEPLRFQELRSFLLDSPAYQWLVENARSSAILTERKGTIVDAIARKVDDTISSMRSPKSWRFQMFQINFNIHWDLPNFLMGQEYETTSEIAVEHAITVTGSGSNTQALSCMEYMRQTWPSSGREVLRMLQKALISPNLSYSSCLADGTELDISLRSPRVSVVARGGQAALTELCEQLAWLGAALQNSPVSSGVCLATPNITISKDAHPSNEVPSVTVQIAFTITPLPDHDLSTHLGGTCWHAMFRNPTVVNGFPILARHESEQGLELPLDLMSVLAEAHFATRYGTILLLKGLCTMLVPTRQTKNSVTWHFLLNEDGNRMPYYSFRERCPSWVGVDKVSMGFLEAGNVRHFVGWASHITRHLGTKDVKYEQIDWSGAKQCSPGLAIEQKLTISVSKILGGSMTAVRGNRDKPMYVKHSGYSIQIKQARKKYVVLYDTEAQRGWLIDGASALLHLVRTQTVQEPYGGQDSLFNPSKFKHPGIDQGPDAAENVLKDESNMQHVILREFSSYADETIDVPHHEAMSIVGEESDNVMNKRSENAPNSVEGRRAIYKTTCLRELVSQTWSTLELIFDHQTDVARTHTTTQLTNPFQTKLEGYEFMDIVSARTSLTRRAVELQSNGPTWIVLTRRIQAITLFGQHFGDMYKPTEDAAERICKLWQTVPQGHEYLAVPISLLKEIKQRSWEDGEIDASSPEIAKGLICSPSSDAFRTCEPCCKHSFIRVQQPCSSKPAEILARIAMDQKAPREVNPFVEINGALLFGKNSDLDVKKLEILSPPAVHKESSFHDSGIGPSLQFSSQASSSNTNPVTNPDTQPMRPWADSMGTSPSPLDQTRPKNTSGDRTKSLSLRQSDDDTTARRASLSQQALSPGPASVNKSTDVPFSDQAHSWRRSLVASLEKVATRIIPSWRKRAVTIAPRR